MLEIENSIWDLVKESKLFSHDQLEKISSDPEASELLGSAKNGFTKWLVDNNWITEYQALVLDAGLSGPFVFGSYVVRKRVMDGPFQGVFRAIHRKTGHKVALHFMKGDQPSDLERWQRWLEQIRDLGNGTESMSRIYQAVDYDTYRFVVSEDLYGKPLIEKVPAKGRFPWDLACRTVLDVAVALKAIHKSGHVHGAINLNSVWMTSSGRAKLWPSFLYGKSIANESDVTDPSNNAWYDSPERRNDDAPTIQADMYSLGCLLVRLLGSNPPTHHNTSAGDKDFAAKAIDSLAKYDLPNDLLNLIKNLLEYSYGHRLADVETVIRTIDALDVEKAAAKFERPESQSAYLTWLAKEESVELPGKKPVFEDTDLLKGINADEESRTHIQSRTPKWVTPVGFSIAALILVGLVAWGAYKMGQTTITVENQSKNNGGDDAKDPSIGENNSPNNGTNNDSGNNDSVGVKNDQLPIIDQIVKKDDGETLWQSPTTGPAINFDLVPPAPRIIFAIRPRDIIESKEGQRFIQSLGPDFKALMDQWIEVTQIDLREIRHFIISMHTGENDEYLPCFVIELYEEVKREALLEKLGQPSEESSGQFGSLYSGKATYFFLPTSVNTNEKTTIRRIVVGPKDELEGFVNVAPGSTLAGPMLKLSRWADHDRHFTTFFVRSALFNTEGQKLMKGPFAKLTRPFDLFLHDSVNGLLFSFHLDHGTYIELMLEHNVDIRSEDLSQWLEDKLSETRDLVIKYVASLSSNEYWNQVKALYPGMLVQLRKEMRFGAEHNHVVANCWLPPTALENLVVASELTLSSTPGVTVTVAKPKSPKDLSELLQTKRSIDIVSQDLINCIDGFKTEISDDFGNLPFRFDIKLLGNDLRADGITQNQRISDFSRADQPISTILTEMLFQANPDKNADSPKDPRCKLVWVIADDPENAGEKIILITTRTAAKNKGWELPPDFQE